jgi:DNA-binding NarL/FixJ family response regulator
VRILVVDDHELFVSGLTSFLGAAGETVVGSARDGAEALAMARATRPELVLMDVHLPDMSGFEATLLIKAEMPRVRVVMLTVHDDADYVARSIRAGAEGYLLKSASEPALQQALRGLGDKAATPPVERPHP